MAIQLFQLPDLLHRIVYLYIPNNANNGVYLENKDDYYFSRLNNEIRQAEEQKRLINQRKIQSQQNWATKALHEIGDFLGKVIAAPFKLLGDLISYLFGH